MIKHDILGLAGRLLGGARVAPQPAPIVVRLTPTTIRTATHTPPLPRTGTGAPTHTPVPAGTPRPPMKAPIGTVVPATYTRHRFTRKAWPS